MRCAGATNDSALGNKCELPLYGSSLSGISPAASPFSFRSLHYNLRRDVVGDEDVAKLKATLSGGAAPVETNQFRSSGHLPHLDEREEYVQVN